ncbi:hypothetical protein ANN_00521 [Periplaneta americana]|uniref:Uncharacterized protein n=1 Tax=Periplaneta americana TaxID=6978 RepID=A0ABQ8TR02_PERAM|nr:hypothetical protein ANN_00521 [Periplaneta americana]
MSPGSSTESYPAFAHIGLRKTRKNLNQGGHQNIDSQAGVASPRSFSASPRAFVAAGGYASSRLLTRNPFQRVLTTTAIEVKTEYRVSDVPYQLSPGTWESSMPAETLQRHFVSSVTGMSHPSRYVTAASSRW